MHSDITTMNKDLVLREHLAIERTKLANERTLLTYIRTALYFLVAGSTLGHFVDTTFWRLMGLPLMILSVIIIIFGIVRFFNVKKTINESRKHIGNASVEFMKAVKGDDLD
jgi:inner membrane protein YidH